VRAEVLETVARMLFHGGLTAVTFDKVAAASGASKTTLYKWWPSPGSLAAEAYFAGVWNELGFDDTGDIEADLASQLRAFVHLMTREPAGRVARELIGAAQTDPDLRAAFVREYSLPRRDEAITRLRRAQDRGQLAADAPLTALVDQLWGACYHRILLLNEEPDDRLVDDLVRTVFHGAGPRGTADA